MPTKKERVDNQVSIANMYEGLSEEERLFVDRYLDTFDGVEAVKLVYKIEDENVARIKFYNVMKKQTIALVIESAVEEAWSEKKIKFNILRLGQTVFDPGMRLKVLELMARIKGMLDKKEIKEHTTIIFQAFAAGQIKRPNQMVECKEVTDGGEDKVADSGNREAGAGNE